VVGTSNRLWTSRCGDTSTAAELRDGAEFERRNQENSTHNRGSCVVAAECMSVSIRCFHLHLFFSASAAHREFLVMAISLETL
jgi:hypothetical protein